MFYADTSTIIAFRTCLHQPQNGNDSIFGYIAYDHVLHQFKPVIRYHFDTDSWHNGGYAWVVDNMVGVAFTSTYTLWGEIYSTDYYEAYVYDLSIHDWKGGSITSASSYFQESVSMSLGIGGLVSSHYNDWDYNPAYSRHFYDPVLHAFSTMWHSKTNPAAGDQDVFYSFGDIIDIYERRHFAAFDPFLHQWSDVYYSPFGNIFVDNGIFYSEGGGDSEIGIYDDSLHQWVIDYHANSYYNSDEINITIKDKVVAYSNSAETKIYCQVFSPTSRTWVKDSTQTNGINNLSIVEGTVHGRTTVE